ncbi:MAG: glycerol-3-phosphate acyltransferase [Dehalococcoidia bacterium]
MEDASPYVLALIALGGYLMGSFPTAYVVVRQFAGKNVMDLGTGNVGTLNTLRATRSKSLAIGVLLGDIGKGGLAILLGYLVALALDYDVRTPMEVAGILAVVGHNYSPFLRFRGGKGLATSLPILLYMEPILVAVWLGVFFLMVLLTRLMVLGQIMGTVALPLVGVAAFRDSIVPVAILAAIVFVKHAPRIRNILNGTEPRMYYKIREASR